MAKVSLCMIVKNEESILRTALTSIADIADEIIITDTGSTDKTIDIAKEFTDRIYHFEWIDDFSAARNFCSQYAQYAYILRWDADFIVRGDGLEQMWELKARDFENVDINFFKWNVEFNEEGTPTKSLQNPFFYKKDLFHWESPIHNDLVLNDRAHTLMSKYYADIEVDHAKDPEVKKHRYAQTKRIIEQTLAKEPNNTYLMYSYGDSLLFEKNYEAALHAYLHFLTLEKNWITRILSAIESAVFCYLQLGKFKEAKTFVNHYYSMFSHYPVFLLTYADATAVADLQGAKEYYLKYITIIKNNPDINLTHNIERYQVHPYFMMEQIYLVEKNIISAMKMVQYIEENSLLPQTKNNARLLINNFHKNL